MARGKAKAMSSHVNRQVCMYFLQRCYEETRLHGCAPFSKWVQFPAQGALGRAAGIAGFLEFGTTESGKRSASKHWVKNRPPTAADARVLMTHYIAVTKGYGHLADPTELVKPQFTLNLEKIEEDRQSQNIVTMSMLMEEIQKLHFKVDHLIELDEMA